MRRRTRRFGAMGKAILALAAVGSVYAAGCSGDTSTGAAECAANGECGADEVCCAGTCELAGRCACVADDECASQPDSGPGAWICCGGLGEGGPGSGRCARPEDCSAPACPVGSGCSVPGGVCAGTQRICQTVVSGGRIIDCTCQCEQGAAGAECDSSGGCSAPKSCNTATCGCECDRAEGAECDPFGGCGSGEMCDLDRCACEPAMDGGARSSDGGDAGPGLRDSAVVSDASAEASGDASVSGEAGDASRDDDGGNVSVDASADASGGASEAGSGEGGTMVDGSALVDGSDDASSGGEGSPCNETSDCNNVCVTGNGSPPATHVYSQICQGGVCTRHGRLETCTDTCSDNMVMAQICVAGACELGEEVENCATKLYGSEDEAGCYQCEDKDPAVCVLSSQNGQWEPWRVSTPSDDATKNGDCAVADDKRVWHTHYCNDPAPSCGGIWCYWTTGAPGGPSSTTEPEFSCRKPNGMAVDGG